MREAYLVAGATFWGGGDREEKATLKWVYRLSKGIQLGAADGAYPGKL
jgi:hypothetical protein